MNLNKHTFKAMASTFHNGKYTYENCIYTNRDTVVTVTCPKHGDFYVTPKNHLRGGNCTSCTLPRVTTTEEFIKRSIVLHKGLYTYTTSEFTKSAAHLTVECRIHGMFSITPNNHLRLKGCPTCALTKRGWGRTKYKGVPAMLYLVQLNTNLFKVGITKKSVKERFAKDIKAGVQITIIQEYHFIEGTDAYDIEKIILSKTSSTMYKGPKVLSHGGDSEIRTESCLKLIEDTIKELHEINRIAVQSVTNKP